jgi:hypothetical protein
LYQKGLKKLVYEPMVLCLARYYSDESGKRLRVLLECADQTGSAAVEPLGL